MTTPRIFGFVLLAAAAVLLIVGLNASDSFVDQASDALRGRYTDDTIWYLTAGSAAAVGGVLLMLWGGGRKVARG